MELNQKLDIWVVGAVMPEAQVGIYSLAAVVYEGALQLLARQRDDGGWDEQGANRTCGTCFALLFLKKATQPLSGGAQD